MPKGFHRTLILGNVGRDPDVRATQAGLKVATFSMAVSEKVKVKGEWTDQTTWYRCVAFGGTADVVGRYVSKGKSLFIEGRMKFGSYDKKDGSGKAYTADLIVDRLLLLGGGQPTESGSLSEGSERFESESDPIPADEDLPF